MSDGGAQLVQTSKQTIRKSSGEWPRQSGIHSARNENSLPQQGNHAFVTPSPKLGIGIVESRKALEYESLKELQPPCHSVQGTAKEHRIWAPPSRGRQTFSSRISGPFIREDFSKGQDFFGPSFEMSSDNELDDVSLIGVEASTERVFSHSNTCLQLQEMEKMTDRNRSQVSWKREKLHQQRTQQRGFVKKKDNPFSDFKCDPNNAENSLDSLSSINTLANNQVIPAEGLKALERAYHEGSQFTDHCRSDFIRSNRVRKSGALRNLTANRFPTGQMPDLGMHSGGSYASVGNVNYQAYRPEDEIDPLAASWQGLPRDNCDYYNSPHPVFADDIRSRDILPARYNLNARGYYREEPTRKATIQNWFRTVNQDTGPLSRNVDGENCGTSTSFDGFQEPTYQRGWG